VTSADVSRLIKERSKEEIDKRKISVPAIKGLGSATATLQLHKEISINIKLSVIEEK